MQWKKCLPAVELDFWGWVSMMPKIQTQRIKSVNYILDSWCCVGKLYRWLNCVSLNIMFWNMSVYAYLYIVLCFCQVSCWIRHELNRSSWRYVQAQKLSSVTNFYFFAWAFQVLISVSHFLLDSTSLSVLEPLTMWLETDVLKWLGLQIPEHQASFSSTCYPFISCFSQPQILPFYSSAIWQPPYIPFHHQGDKAKAKQRMALA